MNRIAIVFLSFVVGAGSACAAERPRARQFFQSIDANGDRKLEFTEIQAARARLFDRMDGDRNGILDAREMQAAVVAAKRQRASQTMMSADLQAQAARMDTNGDGKIARSEFAAFIPERLHRADANGDSVLTLSELRALRR
jgi:hypothetical protein